MNSPNPETAPKGEHGPSSNARLVALNCRVAAEQREFLDQVSEKTGVSVEALVRSALYEYFRHKLSATSAIPTPTTDDGTDPLPMSWADSDLRRPCSAEPAESPQQVVYGGRPIAPRMCRPIPGHSSYAFPRHRVMAKSNWVLLCGSRNASF